MSNAAKVHEFLNKAQTFYFLTTDGDQPKGRPFGFQMLVDDGSLEASLTPARKKKLEQDPEDGTGPDGKRIIPNPEEELQEELLVPSLSHRS